MEKELFIGKVEVDMKENGRMIICMEKESIIEIVENKNNNLH
jgi:hypothetical protein